MADSGKPNVKRGGVVDVVGGHLQGGTRGCCIGPRVSSAHQGQDRSPQIPSPSSRNSRRSTRSWKASAPNRVPLDSSAEARLEEQARRDVQGSSTATTTTNAWTSRFASDGTCQSTFPAAEEKIATQVK